MVDRLIEVWWLGPVIWVCLYVSDYCLTIATARLYQSQDKVAFEGSFEITPYFQGDVDALRRVSPRFIIALVASTGYLLLLRTLAEPGSGFTGLYQLALGWFFLMEATIHTRHLRNWFLFRNVAQLKGRLEYPRGLLLRLSALEVLVFAALYAGIFVVTGSLFVLGGTLGCIRLAVGNYRLAARHDKTLARTGERTA